MTTTPPAVSIIVPCRNERGAIEACVRSILEQKSVSGGMEILVADGCSTDGTRELLAAMAEKEPRLKIIDNPGKIVSTGLNAAIAVATGTIIVRMDAHTTYAEDYVRCAVETLTSSGADCVGGPWIAAGQAYLERAIAAAFGSRFCGGGRAHDASYEGPLDTVYLGCWHRSLFERLGGFDEELVRNQDDELNLRLILKGGTVWQSPRIKSWYRPRNSLRALFRQYQQYGYWKVRVMQKHGRPASIRHLVPSVFVASLALGPLLPLVSPQLGFVWGLGIFVYLCANAVASASVALRSEALLLPILPIVFTTFHVAYGSGFLLGLWDFVVRRNHARERYRKITRPSGPA